MQVSTQGNSFEVVVGALAELSGGMSASSPTFGSVIALINDRLIAAGKPVLGFLEPFLYSTASLHRRLTRKERSALHASTQW